jgi:predicted metal-dependent hydrolase
MNEREDAERQSEILAMALYTLKPRLDEVDVRLYPLAEAAFWGDHRALLEMGRVLREVGCAELAERFERLLQKQPWIDSALHRHSPGVN